MEHKTTRRREHWVMGTCLLAVLNFLNSSHAESEMHLRVASSSSLSSTPSLSSTQPMARVYQCTLAGQRVFSDQPCGADAIARDIDAPNRMDVGEVHNDRLHQPTHAARSARRNLRAAADSTDDMKKRCGKLSDEKARMTARMRTGYSGAQGERWRDRLRKLDSDVYELRCSRYR